MKTCPAGGVDSDNVLAVATYSMTSREYRRTTTLDQMDIQKSPAARAVSPNRTG